MSFQATRVLRRPTAIFLNSSRLNYDKRLDYSRLSALTNLTCNEVDNITSTEEIVSLVQKHQPEIVITKEMEVPSQALEQFPPSVKLLCESGTGYNNIPVALAREKGMDVVNIPTYSNESVAHMVITYIMNFGAAMFDQARMLHNNDRRNFTVFQHPIYEITNKTLGMIGGSGTIGTCVADVAIPLGMNIVISSRSGKLPKGHKYENHPKVKVVDFDDVFRLSDFVSINCPLNAETRHSVGAREIKLMKPTAFLINTARGAIINEKELIQCMKDRVIAGAGLDTQETEPPAEDSEIWNLDNVFLTPHIGWRRLETRQRLVDMTADNIEAYIRGETKNIVN
ncbi:glycerate dehydrogenase and hydroxypyruvate reductase-like protein [Chaetoceros tenuissimus]|uniref:Glycerate dehydrogenase and hydroxypyruvate reductase-like protein n=1 Tax=Chaetoceros tenuissimus TaxID=426638 RepID=A0AAD3H996_9STRA|nr:glycerate dehydrogenase and hydroxypyruvate reductase-like protein [Chaetoceros tenuissimus]